VTPPLDALVLDGDTRAGLAIARSLGRAGRSLAIAARDPDASGMRTRYARARHALPDPTVDLDEHAAAILAVFEEQPTGAALGSTDWSVAALRARRAEIEATGGSTALASEAALDLAESKEATLALAAELGIPAPRSLPADDAAGVRAAVEELALPVVVKPVRSWVPHGRGGERVAPLLARTPDELGRAASALVGDGASAIVQELATGIRETVKLFRQDGRVLARLAMRSDRTWPPLGGASVMRSTIAPPRDVLGPAEALVDAMGIDGYSEVEFRRDARGRPLLMEVNARLSQSVALAVRAGVDFPLMQLRWATGERVAPVRRYAVGTTMGWLAGDVRLLFARRRGPDDDPGAAGAAVTAAAYLPGRGRIEGLDLRDPGPVAGALSFALAAFRRGAPQD
jgi:predicted ATP-grasp superfamily ATP-dependent carboligase